MRRALLADSPEALRGTGRFIKAGRPLANELRALLALKQADLLDLVYLETPGGIALGKLRDGSLAAYGYVGKKKHVDGLVGYLTRIRRGAHRIDEAVHGAAAVSKQPPEQRSVVAVVPVSPKASYEVWRHLWDHMAALDEGVIPLTMWSYGKVEKLAVAMARRWAPRLTGNGRKNSTR